MEIRGQLVGLGSFSTVQMPGIELGSVELNSKCPYLLSHLSSPLLNTNFKNSFVLSVQNTLPSCAFGEWPICLWEA